VDLVAIAETLQGSALAEWLRTSLKAIPVIEAVHVMAIAIVFGTILIVDLRLLGFPSTRRPFTRVSRELLGWTWFAFTVALVTGALMFVADAVQYYNNTPFRLKMLAIVVAGVNVAIFHGITERGVAAWNEDAPTPAGARAAGALSILLWVTVIFLGRWVGFTQTYDFEVPKDIEFNFDFPAEDSKPE
jgi:hypothetical protein